MLMSFSSAFIQLWHRAKANPPFTHSVNGKQLYNYRYIVCVGIYYIKNTTAGFHKSPFNVKGAKLIAEKDEKVNKSHTNYKRVGTQKKKKEEISLSSVSYLTEISQLGVLLC